MVFIVPTKTPARRPRSGRTAIGGSSQIANHNWAIVEAAKTMTLKEFLLCGDPNVRMFIENFQAKTLASDIRPQYQGPADEILDRALTHLQEFDFVGLSERLEESLVAISGEIGMHPPLSEEEIELIRSLNPLDIALYNEVKTRPEERLPRRGRFANTSAYGLRP